MRKSSRGNPYHDWRGRFTTSSGCLSISEKTIEEYEEQTVKRFSPQKLEEYISRLQKADSREEIDAIVDSAYGEMTSADYCTLHMKAAAIARSLYIPSFTETNPSEFKTYYDDNRNSQPLEQRWRVSSDYLEEDYSHMSLYLSDNGSSFAIHDGDIVSVCASYGGLTRGRHLLNEAVKKGGVKLDAYSGLFSFYTKCGFEPVSICKWDDDYASEDWIKANGFTDDSWKSQSDKNFTCKREDIVFFKYTGKKQSIKFSDWIKTHEYDADYEAAMNRRDNDQKRI